jgi:hypothetical protein
VFHSNNSQAAFSTIVPAERTIPNARLSRTYKKMRAAPLRMQRASLNSLP